MNLNFNFVKDCIRTAHNIGGETYTNICSGVSHTIHWGGMDWIMFGGLSCVILLGLMLGTAIVREI